MSVMNSLSSRVSMVSPSAVWVSPSAPRLCADYTVAAAASRGARSRSASGFAGALGSWKQSSAERSIVSTNSSSVGGVGGHYGRVRAPLGAPDVVDLATSSIHAVRESRHAIRIALRGAAPVQRHHRRLERALQGDARTV